VDPDTISAGIHDKKYQCALSGKQVTFQEVVLLKKASAIVLESVFNELCGKNKGARSRLGSGASSSANSSASSGAAASGDWGGEVMVCPLTGSRLREKDVLKLVKPGSSFAAGGKVETSVYVNTLT
jgi:hypothetical protein